LDTKQKEPSNDSKSDAKSDAKNHFDAKVDAESDSTEKNRTPQSKGKAAWPCIKMHQPYGSMGAEGLYAVVFV
jgi:hypothetical protein